jgi:hypothetical protein
MITTCRSCDEGSRPTETGTGLAGVATWEQRDRDQSWPTTRPGGDEEPPPLEPRRPQPVLDERPLCDAVQLSTAAAARSTGTRWQTTSPLHELLQTGRRAV